MSAPYFLSQLSLHASDPRAVIAALEDMEGLLVPDPDRDVSEGDLIALEIRFVGSDARFWVRAMVIATEVRAAVRVKAPPASPDLDRLRAHLRDAPRRVDEVAPMPRALR